MTLGKRKRNWFTFFLIVIFIIIYVLCVGVLNYLNFHNYITFSFECYWCAVGFIGGTGIFFGLFLFFNYRGRKKRTHRPEKKIVHRGFLILRLVIPILFFSGMGFLFSEWMVYTDYSIFDSLNFSSLIDSLKEFFVN